MHQYSTRVSQNPAFVWDRPTVPEQWEDEPFINGQTKGNTTEGGLLEALLDIPDHSSRRNYELPIFERIFNQEALQKISDDDYEDPTALAVWIHDRNSTMNKSRSYNGAMPTKRFDKVLKQKRFSEPDEVDAHIRRIYLPDPHPTTLGVLALSSSQQQTPMIRKMLYQHLRAETSLSVEFGLGGRTFTFESNIPFFVVRRSKVVKSDGRKTSSGSRIRTTHDLSFLSRSNTRSKDEGISDVLHECHTSMFMTGWNVNFWTAVCLNDTYYYDDDTFEHNEDMLRHYHNCGPPDELNPPFDPLSIGNLTADATSPNDPREYFLLILKHRTQKLKEEWANVLLFLEEGIHQYLADTHIPLVRGTMTLGTVDGHSQAVESDEAWVRQISNLLNKLIAALSKTIKAYQKFDSRDASLIIVPSHPGHPSRTENTNHSIQRIVDDLEGFLDRFNDLKKEVDDFKTQIGLHVAVDGGRAIGLQYWNVTILHFVSPLAVASGIMQIGIGITPSLASFLVLALVVGILTWLIKPLLRFVSQTRILHWMPFRLLLLVLSAF